MALAQLCGLENYYSQNDDTDEYAKLTRNFQNNMELCVPPFANVNFVDVNLYLYFKY